ncbi:MAG: glycosyltransferase family 2 protein [Candidatus Uhrbacteria bacterium]|nr:glycosyltransferase family 2 protein [Candidatus Uhrbacteria bacterium]
MKIIAVIAAYNEASRIGATLLDAKPHVDAMVVVDDCSQDETSARARALGAHVLRHVINRGQGASLQTGMDYALHVLNADVMVHFDADGQMAGHEIPSLVEPIMLGAADVAIGSRFLGDNVNMPKFRRMLIPLASAFTLALSGIRVSDPHNGFRALSRLAAMNMRISLDRMAHASEILDLIKTKRLRFVERPVTIRYSAETLKKGQSTLKAVMTAKDILQKKIIG